MRSFLERTALITSRGEGQWVATVLSTVSELRLQGRSLPRMWTSLDVLPSEMLETLQVLQGEVAEVEATEAVEKVEARELIELVERTDAGRAVGLRSVSSRSVLVGERGVPSTTIAWRWPGLLGTAETISPSAVIRRRGGREVRKG